MRGNLQRDIKEACMEEVAFEPDIIKQYYYLLIILQEEKSQGVWFYVKKGSLT